MDRDMDLHDEADSDLALEKFDFPETLSPDVPKHPEVQEDEENEEKDDAGMEEENEEKVRHANARLCSTDTTESRSSCPSWWNCRW
jgi:hypothetical protein